MTRSWPVRTLRAVAILLFAIGLLAMTYSMIDGYAFDNTSDDYGPSRHWQISLALAFGPVFLAGVLWFSAALLASRRAR
ncbi:MAG: hypothetical protein IIC27_01945 [Chloroflexi bacterium]|nr:hypothetical protein [Chloroflexota bacterium]